jgi:hypothetical protein
MNGICTLANDQVFDQVIALINSIEAIMGADFPICIYPYDNRLQRLQAMIADRPNVTIYDNTESIAFWDHQAQRIWNVHPTAKARWQAITTESYHRMGTHRRFCAFDGPFDRFIYMDADTLLMDDVSPIFESLETYDWYVYDFQHRDITHVYDHTQAKLKSIFSSDRLEREIFCSGFYAARRHTFSSVQLDQLWQYLADGEAAILYAMAPDQTILNYWVMRSNLKIYNPAVALPKCETTGCCVTSSHFETVDNIVYDDGRRLTYLHYIGLPSSLFRGICAGENWECPYRDVFLYYRFWKQPESCPIFVGEPQVPSSKYTLKLRILSRLQRYHQALKPT